MAIPTMSDTINLSDAHAGNANAGNGGNGYNDGTINYSERLCGEHGRDRVHDVDLRGVTWQTG